MDLARRIRNTRELTPTEEQLASTVLAMGERLQRCSIKEFAQASNASIASVHRFCKKLGLEGFKELKVEVARSHARQTGTGAETAVDFNFPFGAGDTASKIAPRMEALYETTLLDTQEVLDLAAVDRAAQLIADAQTVDIYTASHNLYPAQMFCDRLLFAGKTATCFGSGEVHARIALASDSTHVAIGISYSGLGAGLKTLLPVLTERHVPVILIGTPRAERMHPGLDVYLHVTDRESLQNRITQFASHIAVQYVLDTLFSCFFARDYDRNMAFMRQSLPYTGLPGAEQLDKEQGRRIPSEEYIARMLTQLK